MTEHKQACTSDLQAGELPSPEDVARAQSPAGGWSRQQLARWGVAWPPPKGWRQDLAVRYAQCHQDPVL